MSPGQRKLFQCSSVVLFTYVTVSPLPPPVDLSAPGVSLRPPALVTLSRDVVKACGTGDVVCKQRLPGL